VAKVLGLFDKAYVINMDSRPDRMGRMKVRLDKLGIEYERFSACVPKEKGFFPNIGNRGIARSFLTILKMARAASTESVLVFEDDAMFRDDFHELWEDFVPAMSRNSWDIILLGGHIFKFQKTNIPQVARVLNSTQTHAIGYNRRIYDLLIAQLSMEKPPPPLRTVEVLINNTDYVRYCPWPLLSMQEPGMSNLKNRHVGFSNKYAGAQGFRAGCSDPALRARRVCGGFL